jgi:uroporphyrinogen-III synthase
VHELRALGCAAQALPLIDIAAAPDPDAVRQAWLALPDSHLVMFVSANAVAGFFACRPPHAPWPARLLAASTGPGTSAALRSQGLLDSQIVQPPADSPLFDSEALWLQLQARQAHWRALRVWVVRGGQGRDWLADTLSSQGAHVQFVVAYQRQAPQPGQAEQQLLAAALAHPAGHAWLFSSSEAVGHLLHLAPGTDWKTSQAWVTHPRIGQAATAAGFGTVLALRAGVHAAAQEWHAHHSRSGAR